MSKMVEVAKREVVTVQQSDLCCQRLLLHPMFLLLNYADDERRSKEAQALKDQRMNVIWAV